MVRIRNEQCAFESWPEVCKISQHKMPSLKTLDVRMYESWKCGNPGYGRHAKPDEHWTKELLTIRGLKNLKIIYATNDEQDAEHKAECFKLCAKLRFRLKNTVCSEAEVTLYGCPTSNSWYTE